MASHIVGYPRMGPKRELKFALESFWDGKTAAEDLQSVATNLRSSIWKQMAEAEIKYIPSNTFSYYDQVLDTTTMLGAVPPRYNWNGGEIGFDTYFSMVFINVPFLYLTFFKIINPFFTQRTKSKFVFAGPSKTAETLFKYIAPELVPVQYGGLSRESEHEFTSTDSVTEEIIKPATKHCIDFPALEPCTLVWEARVMGNEVTYGAEFVPTTEAGYTVIIQKSRKVTATTDEPVICGTFKCSEQGKVVLTFDNQTSKKKKVLYRSKTKTTTD